MWLSYNVETRIKHTVKCSVTGKSKRITEGKWFHVSAMSITAAYYMAVEMAEKYAVEQGMKKAVIKSGSIQMA